MQRFRFGERSTGIVYSEDLPKTPALAVVDDALDWHPKDALRVSAGEAIKSFSHLEAILDYLYERGASRGSSLLVAGGGTLTDLGAFAASIYLRGIDVILVPTTMLAMVDAAVGGKTGINFHGHKNMVGSFYPASTVYIRPSFLKTLAHREYLSGLAELIKAAMLGDASLLNLLEKDVTRVLECDVDLLRSELLPRAIAVKGHIVEQDFREAGLREHLNLGHTFAHALEAVSDFGYAHGEAVAWGLRAALSLGLRLGSSDVAYVSRMVKLLDTYGYRKKAKASAAQVLDAMRYDKKRKTGELRFVLQRSSGDTFVREVERSLVEEVLKDLLY